MKTIRVKKGYNLRIAGTPSTQVQQIQTPSHLALLPGHIPFVRPRLKVKKGDRVALGSPLIEDKRNTDIQFLSPGGGRVTDIRFGPRRVIQEIVIQLEDTERKVEFQRYSLAEIDKLSREQLIQALVTGGVWPLIRALPYRDYARPDGVPTALYVCLDSLEPFHPSPQVYLAGNEALFQFGLSVLNKLAQAPVYVCQNLEHRGSEPLRNGWVNLTYTGPYPAHDPGVLLYHMKSSPAQNRAWYINGQDVLMIARLLQKGVFPSERMVSLGGSGARNSKHIFARVGVPLSAIAVDGTERGKRRYIQGGIFTGFGTSPGSYLGFFETALNILPEGDQKGELLGLFAPGFRKNTYSRAFLSAFNADDLEMNCNMHGGERACIACGYCAQVCPVDILPQFTYKAVLAGDVEESLAHGLLDCVECGLCAYVCPSKIELLDALKRVKADLFKEQEA